MSVYRVAAIDEGARADRADIDAFRSATLRARRRARAVVAGAAVAGIGAFASSLGLVGERRRPPTHAMSAAPPREPLGPQFHNCATTTARCSYDSCWEAFDSQLELGAWYRVSASRLSQLCEPLPGVRQIPDCDSYEGAVKSACLSVTREHPSWTPDDDDADLAWP